MSDRICAVGECDRELIPPYGRGMCSMHYQRWRKHGDPLYVRDRRKWPPQCSIEECDKPTLARGWCSAHWTRWQRNGDPESRLPGEVVDGCRICPACGMDKTLSAFAEGRTGPCRDCVSRRARVRRAFRPDPLKPRRATECRACGVTFAGNKLQSAYCSRDCADGDRHKANWKHVAARRARMREQFVEAFSRQEIFERDSWTCGICQQPIDPNEQWPSVLCAVIDHKHPVSRGGEHSRANAQAAHNGCNIRKSNKVLEAAK